MSLELPVLRSSFRWAPVPALAVRVGVCGRALTGGVQGDRVGCFPAGAALSHTARKDLGVAVNPSFTCVVTGGCGQRVVRERVELMIPCCRMEASLFLLLFFFTIIAAVEAEASPLPALKMVHYQTLFTVTFLDRVARFLIRPWFH